MSKAKTKSKIVSTKKSTKQTKQSANKSTKRAPARKSTESSLLTERLQSIDAATVALAPNKPVKVALLEGERLRAGTTPHRKTLLALPGFRTDDIALLPLLLEALEESEKRWSRLKARQSSPILGTARKKAERWRHDAMAAARYLSRRHAGDIAELNRIAEGEGLADLVQDLDDLVSFVESRAKDFAKLPNAVNVREAQKLAATLREGRDANEVAEALAERNRAFWALEDAVTEIRAALRFVFRDQPKKLTPLLSRYQAERQAKYRRTKAGEERRLYPTRCNRSASSHRRKRVSRELFAVQIRSSALKTGLFGAEDHPDRVVTRFATRRVGLAWGPSPVKNGSSRDLGHAEVRLYLVRVSARTRRSPARNTATTARHVSAAAFGRTGLKTQGEEST